MKHPFDTAGKVRRHLRKLRALRPLRSIVSRDEIATPPMKLVPRYEAALQGQLLVLRDALARDLEASIFELDERADADDPFIEHLKKVRRKWLTEIEASNDNGPEAARVAYGVAKESAKQFKKKYGIVVRDDPKLAKAIDEFRTKNVRLIRSIKTQYLDEVSELIENAHAGTIRVESLREEIAQRFSVSQSRASLIARDQILKLNANLTQFRQRDAGIEEYVWITSNDERVRGNPAGKYPNATDNHFILNGRTFSWDDPPVVDSRTGRKCHPGEDYQCRCIAKPVLPF